MKAHALPIPGIVLGAYPEHRTPDRARRAEWRDRVPPVFSKGGWPRRYRKFLALLEALDTHTGALDSREIGARLRGVRAAMARDGLTDRLIAQAFVLVKRTCARELGLELYATQMLAARIMLDCRLAEMATGEGKTLAAGVCAATAALAGIPVHVITANDYLVARDAGELRPLYRALGLTCAALTQDLAREKRFGAYDCDIVYATASELVFDYLRDGLVRSRSRSDLEQRVAALDGPAAAGRGTLLRGLCMAIVDEADSVLIDDARVPLILSERRSNEGERDYLRGVLTLAARLAQNEHFVLRRQTMSAELTPAGRQALEHAAAGAPWRNRMHREEAVCTALAALHLYERDRHYLVKDATVNIIDESTGRVAEGRVWSRGLHLMVELKEDCPPSGDTATVAQITYQRFFRRYLALAGMSGTLKEAHGELQAVYGLPVVEVPLSRPGRRTVLATRLYTDRQSKWKAVVAETMKVSAGGRPVLIGTDSVAESEAVSRLLTEAGVAHAVLNARQDREEARIIAEAGRAGQVTVATNMAGRGTDIALGAGVAARGGLHVISCQHNATRRIDRQLVGRCARRGDPGSAQALLALDQPFIARCAPRFVARAVGEHGLESPQWLVRLLVRLPQRLEEARQRAQRRQLLERDRHAAEKHAFGKPLE
jgi:preprotein translocase subunit SecA